MTRNKYVSRIIILIGLLLFTACNKCKKTNEKVYRTGLILSDSLSDHEKEKLITITHLQEVCGEETYNKITFPKEFNLEIDNLNFRLDEDYLYLVYWFEGKEYEGIINLNKIESDNDIFLESLPLSFLYSIRYQREEIDDATMVECQVLDFYDRLTGTISYKILFDDHFIIHRIYHEVENRP